MIFVSFIIAAITTAGYAFNLPWLQVIFLLYLASVIQFALIILHGTYKYGGMKIFASVVVDRKHETIDLPTDVIVIRFITYDVLFFSMLVYLNQPALAVMYISAHALIHFYFGLLTKLEKNNPR